MAFLLKADLLALQDSLPLVPSLEEIGVKVSETLERTKNTVSESTRRLSWEVCLRDDILNLVATEGSAVEGDQELYYESMRKKLDLILVMTEQDACDPTFTLAILQDLMETQTIESCSRVFSWMEARSKLLTRGMEPQKGKALTLLKTLNELLRRLSKTAQTTFCGRILTFLSGAYSLGDRSGVNLRGEYGPLWDDVRVNLGSNSAMEMDPPQQDQSGPSNPSGITVDEISSSERKADEDQKVKVEDTSEAGENKREDFFHTFWSLQNYFSRPPNLTLPGAFEKFKIAVNAVLPVISEANKKERLLMGSKAKIGNVNGKRKRELPTEPGNDYRHDYFFAKFLTSPDLLELEMADTLFRRQILMQLMITLQYLHMLTKTEKAKWHPPKNRSLLTDFTLEAQESAWVMETWTKTMNEIRATPPLGKEFAEATTGVLQRERNWVGWKNEHCPSFDKPSAQPLPDGQLLAESVRLRPKEAWPWAYGTEELTDLFEMGYRGTEDLQNPISPDEVSALVKRIKALDKKIEMRKKQLEIQSKRRAAMQTPAIAVSDPAQAPASNESGTSVALIPPVPASPMARQPSGSSQKPPPPGTHPLPPKPGTIAPPAAKQPVTPVVAEKAEVQRAKQVVIPPAPRDPQLEAFEEEKRKLSWLALRSAREEYWQLFSAAKGNPEKMMWMLERNKEVLKKGDEESFAATGWIEGDTSVLFSEDKPKTPGPKQAEAKPNLTMRDESENNPPGLELVEPVNPDHMAFSQGPSDRTDNAHHPVQEDVTMEPVEPTSNSITTVE